MVFKACLNWPWLALCPHLLHVLRHPLLPTHTGLPMLLRYKHTPQPQGLCTCCSFCVQCSLPQISVWLPPPPLHPRSPFSQQILREAFPTHIKFYLPWLSDSLFSFIPLPSPPHHYHLTDVKHFSVATECMPRRAGTWPDLTTVSPDQTGA